MGDADWSNVAISITLDAESGDMIEDWTLCDLLLEEGSLVPQIRLEPWRAIVQADASATSRKEAISRPPLTLNQNKAFVKEPPGGN